MGLSAGQAMSHANDVTTIEVNGACLLMAGAIGVESTYLYYVGTHVCVIFESHCSDVRARLQIVLGSADESSPTRLPCSRYLLLPLAGFYF